MERVSSLFLAKTTYAAVLVIVTALVGWRYPFLPRQFSYIDSLTIGIPAFFLALWPNPRRYVPGFLKRTLSLAMPTGVILAAAALTAFGIADGPPQDARVHGRDPLPHAGRHLAARHHVAYRCPLWKWVLLVSRHVRDRRRRAHPARAPLLLDRRTDRVTSGSSSLCVGAGAALLIEVAQRIFYARQFARSLEG